MSTVKEVIERLQGYDPDAHIATSLWMAEDVLYTAEDIEIELSEEEANEILDEMCHRHDADIGINWEVIRCYIYMLDEDRREKQNG